ncbi:LysR family transcriptional regulator [Primorskyibacter sp. 2E233]|uniref:LysR family transcriptional regulator n=1 Tax=Primorskyibacter sp. 2E233 TaxID=3413431 RepID=UPI003BF26160
MRMRQLEVFRATILNGTLSAAARSLNMTQPTVSRMLADLEHSLNFPLFLRRKGRVVPTPEGMEFYQRLDDVFSAFVQLRHAADDISRNREKELKIVSLPALSASVVPETLARFALNYPDIKAQLITADIPTYFNLARDPSVDICIGNQLGDQPGVEQITLAKVDYVCALPPDHHLTARTIVTADDLNGENVIALLDDTNRGFDKHEDLFQSIDTRQQFQTQNSGNAYAMVLRGLGIAILEPFSAPFWAANGVAIRPFRPRLSYKYAACYSGKKIRSSAVDALVKTAKDVFKQYESGLGPSNSSKKKGVQSEFPAKLKS